MARNRHNVKVRRAAFEVVDLAKPELEWTLLGLNLEKLDPPKFRRILALCRALVALHTGEPEPDELWHARLLEIRGGGGGAVN